jgi:hypothetical protein
LLTSRVAKKCNKGKGHTKTTEEEKKKTADRVVDAVNRGTEREEAGRRKDLHQAKKVAAQACHVAQ